MHIVELEILDQRFALKTADETLYLILSAVYKPFVRNHLPAGDALDGSIEISATGTPVGLSVRHRKAVTRCETIAHVLYTIDKIITIELQLRRPDLYFVHAAAVSIENRAILIVGEPGAGKSTLCWSLCSAGYRYLSDELAPVGLPENNVHPVPRAISLKNVIDDSPALPVESIDAGATLHVPADVLPGGCEISPPPIAAVVFLLPNSQESTPSFRKLPVAEAAARLYSNGLNQLAHEDDGLKAAAKIVTSARNFALTRTRLSLMVKTIGKVMEVE